MDTTDTSRNSYDMEQIAAHAEKMANAGAERFHPSMSPPPPPMPMPMPVPPPSNTNNATANTNGAASTMTPHDSFEVYNPVDDSFASWQENDKIISQQEQQQQQRQSASDSSGGGYDDDDNGTSFFTVKKLPYENSLEQTNISSISNNNNTINGDQDTTRDTVDRLVDEVQKNSNNTDNNHIATNNNSTPMDDDALARAVAEQDLPPGVSAIEQQEIMMRLLTQQLRRGGGGDSNDEPLSPALEQRLRDFQFAQRKRRETYGNERPWGVLGLYDHLAGIRLDVEWAEDAAWRRTHKEPYLSWSDFQQTRHVGWNRPFFTYTLLFACTTVLIVSYGLNGWQVEPLSINPMIGPSAETLIRMGAKYTPLIVNQGEWYRLFSPMVLHAGLIHYFLNMAALWFIGKAVEQCHGFAAAAILFIIPAVGGTILSAIFLPEYITVGASGGIFGLIGACIADICINWSLLFSKQVNASDEGVRLRHMKVLLWLLFDIVVNCLVGLTPFVDNFTHLGGMVYGILCGLSTIERLSTDFFGMATTFWGRVRNVLIRFSGLIISVVLILITTAVLVNNDDGKSPCPNCRYLSCVPFPPWAGEDDKWWYCDDCSMITADAILDSSGYYSLSMTCPDGAIEQIDLSDQLVTDRQWIQKQLPTFCRKYCDKVFAT